MAINYSRSRQDAEQTAVEVRSLGVRAELYACNVADDQAVRKMLAQCRQDFGGFDVLVNNAGTTHLPSIMPISEVLYGRDLGRHPGY